MPGTDSDTPHGYALMHCMIEIWKFEPLLFIHLSLLLLYLHEARKLVLSHINSETKLPFLDPPHARLIYVTISFVLIYVPPTRW